MKKQTGITLIALIITIIILLILAGITISSLTGSRLFEKSQQAEQKQENAQILENAILLEYENTIEQYVSGKGENKEDLNQGNVTLEPGLYDDNGVMLCTWEESGLDVESNYSNSTFVNQIGSGYYVLERMFPETRKVVLPTSVTKIGQRTFQSCRNLTNIEIPSSVTSIGDYAFYSCENLIEISIPDGVTEIGEATFMSCYSLKNIKLPNNLLKIEEGAFSSCTSLTEIYIPDGVETIYKNAFNGCKGLDSIFIPASVSSMNVSKKIYGPFYLCASTLKIYCEASGKQGGWMTGWDSYDKYKYLSVSYGISREIYESTYK